MDKYDILIRGGVLRGHAGQSFDIGVTAGKIAAIEPEIAGSAKVEFKAEGSLVTESFANPHLHLCKVYTL
jgi:cytosine deaminase